MMKWFSSEGMRYALTGASAGAVFGSSGTIYTGLVITVIGAVTCVALAWRQARKKGKVMNTFFDSVKVLPQQAVGPPVSYGAFTWSLALCAAIIALA